MNPMTPCDNNPNNTEQTQTATGEHGKKDQASP